MYFGLTFEQLGGWPGALMIAVCGFVVVFLVLAVLALMITIISKVVAAIEKKLPAKAAIASAQPKPAARRYSALALALSARTPWRKAKQSPKAYTPGP